MTSYSYNFIIKLMNNNSFELPTLECLRCGHNWIPRRPVKPKVCPKCTSPYWNKPKWKGINAEKTGEIIEKLMTFIYDRYNGSDTFKSYGEPASVIVAEFIRESGIELGDAGALQEYMRLLKKKGWIEVVSLDGRSKPAARLFSFSRIKPTLEGISHMKRSDTWISCVEGHVHRSRNYWQIFERFFGEVNNQNRNHLCGRGNIE